MSILFYKRPVYVSKAHGPLDTATGEAYVEKANKCRAAIPPELSFERILGNKTEPVWIDRSLRTAATNSLSLSHAHFRI